MQYTLKEWQLMYEACPIPTRYNVAGGDFLCTRIENTQFECARKFGSCAFYGHRYTYVVAKPGDGIDGGEMIVRNDFLRFTCMEHLLERLPDHRILYQILSLFHIDYAEHAHERRVVMC